MELQTLLISMGSMGGLGALFSAGLAIANKAFYVEEDPRIAQVMDALPGANCGGCGYPGCGNFAENVVKGVAPVNGCPVGGSDTAEEIAAILGVEAAASQRILARVMCQGGLEESAVKGVYTGVQSCLAAHILNGGDKLCEYGCLGFGDCVKACPFDAIVMGPDRLPIVIEEKCTGCGNCAEVCPRDVIEMHPENHRILVLCKNLDKGKYANSVCTKVCIACGLCVRGAEPGEVELKNGLAVINYDKFGDKDVLPTDRCPNNCMLVFHPAKSVTQIDA
jgi:Na+-translocating ferredoxin:NAD+ oxidoreductase subunit B